MKKTTKKARKKGVASYKPTEEVVSEEVDERPSAVERQILTRSSISNNHKAETKCTSNRLQEAIILSEILGKPVSKRRDRRSRVGRI